MIGPRLFVLFGTLKGNARNKSCEPMQIIQFLFKLFMSHKTACLNKTGENRSPRSRRITALTNILGLLECILLSEESEEFANAER